MKAYPQGEDGRQQTSLGATDRFGNTVREKRRQRLLVTFYGAVCAFWDVSNPTTGRVAFHCPDVASEVLAGEPHASVPTCEKVPTSADEPEPSADYVESADDLDYIPDGLEAIRASVGRDRERQEKVLALVQAGEVAHAKRLAVCGRKSVQLECGGCGSDENYVPVSCGSRLCPECMESRMGEKAHQYLPVVEQMEQPTMGRLSLPSRVDPDPESVERAVDALRGAFGRLRRRVVPPSGEGWEWRDWKRMLRTFGYDDLARRWQKRYVEQGKGIPMDEILRGGFYGIDIKQKRDGRLNVHMHWIADVPWLPQAALSALWDDLIDAPVVDIRRIDSDGQQDEETALMEVVGYAAKAPEYESVEDEVAYLKALKGSKLLQPFGELYGNTPPVPSELRCCTCERSPRFWRYLGVVDGRYETAMVHGSDGDRPPPG